VEQLTSQVQAMDMLHNNGPDHQAEELMGQVFNCWWREVVIEAA
jgi:hypothetical protein